MNIARRLQLIALLVMLALGCLSWFSISRLSSANADLSYVDWPLEDPDTSPLLT